jgi:hypothetical protein
MTHGRKKRISALTIGQKAWYPHIKKNGQPYIMKSEGVKI